MNLKQTLCNLNKMYGAKSCDSQQIVLVLDLPRLNVGVR